MSHQITKTFEVESAHFLLKHYGKCRHLHGHRYQVDITLTGMLAGVTHNYVATDDMLVDFSFLKAAFQETIAQWDHSLLVPYTESQWQELIVGANRELLTGLGLTDQDHIIFIGGETTAETLAFVGARLLVQWFNANCPRDILKKLDTISVRIHETSTSSAITYLKI